MKIATCCPACGGSALNKNPAVLMPFVAKRVFDWDITILEEGQSFSICKTMRCLSCGCVFCDIRFDDDEMERLYKGYRGDEYTQMRAKYEPDYPARSVVLQQPLTYMDDIEAFLKPFVNPPLRILDWGGDTGVNTPYVNNATSVHIYDISGNKPTFGQAVDEPNPPYDLTVLENILEHVPYPDRLLKSVAQILGEGVLYIEVPFVPSMFKSKMYWHEHINFYTEAALSRLVHRCGLKIVAEQLLPPVYMVACVKE
jgi:hypothetical protein